MQSTVADDHSLVMLLVRVRKGGYEGWGCGSDSGMEAGVASGWDPGSARWFGH